MAFFYALFGMINSINVGSVVKVALADRTFFIKVSSLLEDNLLFIYPHRTIKLNAQAND